MGGELQPIKRKITVITKYFLNLLLARLYLNIMLAIYVVSAKVFSALYKKLLGGGDAESIFPSTRQRENP